MEEEEEKEEEGEGGEINFREAETECEREERENLRPRKSASRYTRESGFRLSRQRFFSTGAVRWRRTNGRDTVPRVIRGKIFHRVEKIRATLLKEGKLVES